MTTNETTETSFFYNAKTGETRCEADAPRSAARRGWRKLSPAEVAVFLALPACRGEVCETCRFRAARAA